eukprot:TRINITY_DN33003_c0_g1_i1.p1 TRINITY_DN33003_c0_g1~~TRINITY_DN33003_c0_g1_i1.p1  ORF type:complete len:212 (+),score=37.23 TRINITY_DN33003_c0_g1_i1:20-655(+)
MFRFFACTTAARAPAFTSQLRMLRWYGKRLASRDLRARMVIDVDGSACEILTADTRMEGRGSATTTLQVQDTLNGKKQFLRCRSQDLYEVLEIKQQAAKFLRVEDDEAVFEVASEDEEEGEELTFPVAGIPSLAMFYPEMPLNVGVVEDAEGEKRVIRVTPPTKGVYEVLDCSARTATIANGVKVKVPEIVKKGDKIVVSFVDGVNYLQRA